MISAVSVGAQRSAEETEDIGACFAMQIYIKM